MTKLTITCRKFRPLRRGTLVGFATVEIAEMQLTIRDVAIHQKGLSRWAQLPAKPQVKDGELVKDAGAHIMDFTSKATREAFSLRVISAVLASAPDAFDQERAA